MSPASACRRRHGRTSSRIPLSASASRNAAAGSRGRRTVTSFVSRRGRTIRSRIRAAKSSISPTSTVGPSGHRRRRPRAAAGDPEHAPRYVVTHAPGVTRFAHARDGISTELTLGVPREDAVKIAHLRIRNDGSATRRLALTSLRGVGARRRARAYAASTAHALRRGVRRRCSRRTSSRPISRRVSRSRGSAKPSSATRRGAIISSVATGTSCRPRRCGEARSPAPPAPATTRARRCSAPSRSRAGESRDVAILLGVADSDEAARVLIERYGAPDAALAAIDDAVAAWDERLSVITARTPDPEFDVLLNRWSLYQALSCRMWARSALYQSSGAYGFRDQLQDSMAFVYAEPAITREHLLRAAGRQFVEGDVQHWWHEPSGRGVRTRFSDDLALVALRRRPLRQRHRATAPSGMRARRISTWPHSNRVSRRRTTFRS